MLDDITVLSYYFESVVWSFVKKAGNSVTHALAHFQPMEIGKRCWEDDFPDSIVYFASNDLINLSLLGYLEKKISDGFLNSVYYINIHVGNTLSHCGCRLVLCCFGFSLR